MAPPAGRLGPAKHPVQVRLAEDEVALIDGFAAELSRQSYGATFSRAEAIKLAALTWLRERQAGKVDAPPVVPQVEDAAAVVLPAAKKRGRR